MKAMEKFTLILMILLVLGCDGLSDSFRSFFHPKPESIGSPIEWNVFASSHLADDFISTISSDTLRMPQREPFRKFYPVPMKEWEIKNRLSNIVWILSLTNPEQKQIAVQLLTEKAFQSVHSGRVLEKVLENVWAKNQKVLTFFTLDHRLLSPYLLQNQVKIEETLKELEREQMISRLYKRNEREKMGKELQEKYGWSFRIPRDWEILEEGENYVWFGKALPHRWFLVSWKDSLKRAPNLLDWKEDIAEAIYGEIEIDTMARIVEKVFLKCEKATAIRGLWSHRDDAKGGPFKSFAFFDSAINRWFFVDCHVFAPGREKMQFIREMETMVSTFSVD